MRARKDYRIVEVHLLRHRNMSGIRSARMYIHTYTMRTGKQTNLRIHEARSRMWNGERVSYLEQHQSSMSRAQTCLAKRRA